MYGECDSELGYVWECATERGKGSQVRVMFVKMKAVVNARQINMNQRHNNNIMLGITNLRMDVSIVMSACTSLQVTSDGCNCACLADKNRTVWSITKDMRG